MKFSASLVASLVISFTLAAPVYAQLLATDPDWKESEAPPPPALNLKGLLPFEVTAVSNLTWALDPASTTIVGDGLVRYVVVARSQTGVVNALYEVINCSKGEFKTYARIVGKDADLASKAWVTVQDPKWVSFYDGLPSKHAPALAQQAVCTGKSAVQTVDEIVSALKRTSYIFKNKAAP
jgi:CNP1-like family